MSVASEPSTTPKPSLKTAISATIKLAAAAFSLLFFSLSVTLTASAQTESAVTSASAPATQESIQTLREQAAASADIPAETKGKIDTAYASALEGLQKIEDLRKQADQKPD